MSERYSRRKVLQGLGSALAVSMMPIESFAQGAPPDIELRITRVGDKAFRLSVVPVSNGTPAPIPMNGTLVRDSWGDPTTVLRGAFPPRTIKLPSLALLIHSDPLTVDISDHQGKPIQTLAIDRATGALSFQASCPIHGLGEGGYQFDRRGSRDRMRSGQGGYQLATHGSRVPIPWVIGTEGWAIYFHQPLGTFDLTEPVARFIPEPTNPLPVDLFFAASPKPEEVMEAYAELTGRPELPPLWSFGYQQSHRTLASREEVLAEAKTFREKRLPCDTLIYLGTGFCPSGWNVENGSFDWNRNIFPDPKEMLDRFHADHFHGVFHVVITSRRLNGTVHDPFDLTKPGLEQATAYWNAHRPDLSLGVDGWWPDEGDPLDLVSRLVRNRMYWEGPQIDRPNERPFALHRNGAAGMQRYASFLWSGDVDSTWETLKTHLPIAINTGLSGIPYWGTDIGGFVPTKEFSAELYLRWFQFGAFCPLFRCHGRNWKLRLPWGWNTGDPGPIEIRNYSEGAVPDASQLHDARVEPICRKYLELRSRLLPYLYSVVRLGTLTGMPILRGLWLHYPDDPIAVSRDDEYLWGEHVLVAPVVENGATSRKLYLPKGAWFDFWTGERIEGGREIERPVDLETMPLYVRAGTILPLGPVKQYVDEPIDEPLSLHVYPGSNAEFLLYEDDGKSFDYRKGDWMGIEMKWDDVRRSLRLQLAAGSRMREPRMRKIEVTLGGAKRQVEFTGRPVSVVM